MSTKDNESAIDSNDLVSAKYAAKVIERARATFFRLVHKQLVPSPVITKPIQLWSVRQLRLSRIAEIQKHPDTGIWYIRDQGTLDWTPLPNQYINTLPDAAA